jgi:hypothetical protein
LKKKSNEVRRDEGVGFLGREFPRPPLMPSSITGGGGHSFALFSWIVFYKIAQDSPSIAQLFSALGSEGTAFGDPGV